MWPCLITADTGMVWTESGKNNMKALIDSALYQQFRLVGV